ncbi:hypothetical protein RRG08_008176 [Elysia crispata]|uniref:Integrase catalytic domain-containing protein n=1 Tax=Elysia crispata TaxID=231223 RepID=A0AAE0Y0C3_9GAST|nr:hypothetical protein RRG08_008176 [Elysia crispata]
MLIAALHEQPSLASRLFPSLFKVPSGNSSVTFIQASPDPWFHWFFSVRGPRFTSALWSDIADKLGINIHRTCAYQSNGLVERFHRSLKTALKARLQGPNWVDELRWVLLGLRTVPKEDLETSSAKLVYGESVTVPGEFNDGLYDYLLGSSDYGASAIGDLVAISKSPTTLTEYATYFRFLDC